MHRGYIKLWRSSVDNDLYFSEPFTKFQAWCDLLLLANYKPRKVAIRGILVDVDAGQVLAADDFLAHRWKWSRDKVRRFTSYLASKTIQQIALQKTNVCTVITVLKWNLYQSGDTADDTPNDTAERQQTIHTKEYKEGKEGKEYRAASYPDDFSRWWSVYKKGSKAQAFTAWKKQRISEDMVPILISATETYKAYCQSIDRPLKDGQGWVNGRYWENEWTHAVQGTKPATAPAGVHAPRNPTWEE